MAMYSQLNNIHRVRPSGQSWPRGPTVSEIMRTVRRCDTGSGYTWQEAKNAITRRGGNSGRKEDIGLLQGDVRGNAEMSQYKCYHHTGGQESRNPTGDK